MYSHAAAWFLLEAVPQQAEPIIYQLTRRGSTIVKWPVLKRQKMQNGDIVIALYPSLRGEAYEKCPMSNQAQKFTYK